MTLPFLQTDKVPEGFHRTQIATAVNQILKGRANNTGTVTLTANAASTTVTDTAFQSDMWPILIPTTANAAAAIASTYVSARSNGSFTLAHANNAQVDKTFGYVRWG